MLSEFLIFFFEKKKKKKLAAPVRQEGKGVQTVLPGE